MSGVRAAVALVEMVDALRARGEYAHGLLAQEHVHQVEVVAALFDQRPAGVGVEAVPVADLRDRTAGDARGSPPGARGRRRRRASFGSSRRPAACSGIPGRPRRGAAPASRARPARRARRRRRCVVHSGFSTRMCRSVASASRNTPACVKLGVAITTASQSPLASRSRWCSNVCSGVSISACASAAALRARVGDGGDDRAGQHLQVLDMLAAHAPTADDAVTDLLCHGVLST